MEHKLIASSAQKDIDLFIPEWLFFDSNALFLDIIRKAYTAPERGYHGLKHIQEMLVLWREHGHLLKMPVEVYLAIMFHDIIYEVGDPQYNEVRSARFAREYLSRYLRTKGISINRVCHLIKLTAQHGRISPDTPDNDVRMFLDMDMAIFGASRKRFMEYEKGVFKEYYFYYPMEVYLVARIKFLEGLYEHRDKLFLSEHFNRLYHARAEDNLRYLIKRLKEVYRTHFG